MEVTPGVTVDLESVTKVEFEPHRHDRGRTSEASKRRGYRTCPRWRNGSDNIPALQQIRQTVGSGTGTTGWVRARKEGVIGDDEDSYVNLTKVGTAVLGSARMVRSPD